MFKIRFTIIILFFTLSVSAQMNRTGQANNITSNIYQNSSHAITGAALQQVMLNQNNSYVNVLSDTNLLDIRLFSPYATYTPGMGIFYQDTLFMNIATAHGTWNRNDWIKINGSSCACSILMKYDDTVGGSGINKIATTHSVAEAIAGISLTGAVSGSMSTGGSSGINTTLSNSVVGISNLSATGTPSASAYLRGDNTWATLTNYMQDTMGGSGTKPVILTETSGWSTAGNNATSSAFIGTLNAEPLQIKINNIVSGYIDNSSLNNIFLGYEGANPVNVTGQHNTGLGVFDFSSLTSGADNTGVGWGALAANTTGTGNTAIGNGALVLNISGGGCTAIGTSAMVNNKRGGNSTAVGYAALEDDTVGTNTSEGWYALNASRTGLHNVAMGYDVASQQSTASGLAAVGAFAGINNNGSFNSFFGDSSGYAGGLRCVYLGHGSGSFTTAFTNAITVGDTVKSFGSNKARWGNNQITDHYFWGNLHFNSALIPSGNAGTSGQGLLSQGTGAAPQWGTILLPTDTVGGSGYIGTNTQTLTNYSGWGLSGNTITSGQFLGSTNSTYSLVFKKGDTNVVGLYGYNNTNSIGIGYGALQSYPTLSTSPGNVAIGRATMHQIGTGAYNVAIGFSSGANMTTGIANTLLGVNSGEGLENGASYNVIIGNTAVANTSTMGSASYNNIIGDHAGYNLLNGVENIGFGDSTLFNVSNGNFNIAIGEKAGFHGTTYTNAIAIGRLTAFKGSNTSVFGDSLTTDEYTFGNLHFTGALMPNNQAGVSGQGLISQGSGSSPQWGTILLPTDTVGGSGHIGTNTQVLTNYSGWGVNGNAISTGQFLGTTNNQDVVFKRDDTIIGFFNLFDHAARWNIAWGYNNLAEYPNLRGYGNLCEGWDCGTNATDGFFNTFLGDEIGNIGDSVGGNTWIGGVIAPNNMDGQEDVFIGMQIENNNTNRFCTDDVFLGHHQNSNAVKYVDHCIAIGDSNLYSLQTGQYDVALGYQAGWKGINYNNAVAIGYKTQFKGSNTTVLCDSITTDVYETGNLHIQGAGNGIDIATGTNATVGQATLSGGTVTVNTTAVKSNSLIFLTMVNTGTNSALGNPVVTAITANTSFVITSTNSGDNCNVNWFIVNQP